MFCSFFGIGDAQESICDNCVAEKDVGNTLHMEYLWFCFSKLLQDDLDKVKDHWNSHKISKSPYSYVHGVPDVIYFLP